MKMKCPFSQEECIKEECVLWSEAEVRDEQPGILRREKSCAIKLLAQKGGEGYISAYKLMRDENGIWKN